MLVCHRSYLLLPFFSPLQYYKFHWDAVAALFLRQCFCDFSSGISLSGFFFLEFYQIDLEIISVSVWLRKLYIMD